MLHIHHVQQPWLLQQQSFAGHSARLDPDPHLATGSSWSMPRQASKWRAQHCSRENSLCTCAETQLAPSRRDHRATQTQRMQDAVLWVHVTSRWMAVPLQSVEGLLFLADNAASAVSVAIAASACSHTFGGCTTRALVEGNTVKEAQSVLLERSALEAAAPHQGEPGVQARQLRRHEARVPARHRQLWPKTPIAFHSAHVRVKTDRRKGFHLPSRRCQAASGRRRCALDISTDPGRKK